MTDRVESRAQELFLEHQQGVHRRTDRLFAVLMIGQWLFAIIVALTLSPYGWEGKTRAIHAHVWAALLLGGALSSLPVALVLLRPGQRITRHVIAVAQMLWSALLIHLSGGRIETHFHVFGSLAFLAFYRDWTILVPATLVVASDHLIRQIVWPESVYGIVNPEWWRFLEHAFWVAFEDIVLIMWCIVGVREMRAVARARAEVEALVVDLRASQESVVKSEKLAAVGQLAASVGHELRNPLAAVRNANAFLAKRLKDGADVSSDPRVKQFIELIDRELGVCTRIISDLLDFARERPPSLAPCSLRLLADEAIGLIPAHQATIVNRIPDDLPIVHVDKDQFRQVLVNLVQNAVEAVPTGQKGRITLDARGEAGSCTLTITDDGPGIEKDALPRIFEPLFTTKTKGTGLGLAIVSNVIKRHHGSIDVETRIGHGTTFSIVLPTTEALAKEVA